MTLVRALASSRARLSRFAAALRARLPRRSDRRVLKRPRTKAVWGVVAVVVIVVGAGRLVSEAIATNEGAGSPDPDEYVTATVERRELLVGLVSRGTVISPGLVGVTAPTPAEGQFAVAITGLPKAAGDEIHAGEAVAELNNRPVLALPGVVPFFRDIRPGDTGADVQGLQTALRAIGLSIPEFESGTFGRQSQAAVEQLYANAGYAPPYTQGDRASVDRAVDDAEAAVAQAQQELNDARNVAVTESPDTTADLQTLVDGLASAKANRDHVRATEGVVAVAREFVATPNLPAVLVGLPVSVGDVVDAGNTVASIGSGDLQVAIELTAGQVNEIGPDVTIEVDSDDGSYHASCMPGEPVEATTPAAPPAQQKPGSQPTTTDEANSEDGNGPTDGGSTSIGNEPGGADQSSGGTAVEGDYVMTVACDPRPPTAILGGSVRARITVRLSDGPVLVVPSTAIVTAGSGDTHVEVVGPDNRIWRVAVEVGGEAEGFNMVEPLDDRIHEGDAVRVRRG